MKVFGIQGTFLFNVNGILAIKMLETKKFKDLTLYYRKNSADEKVLEHSLDKDIFYPELYDLEKKDSMTIIDVGAHIGTFTMLSTIKLNKCKIISIEPNPESFSILKKNIEFNGITNVIPVEAALTDRPGPVKLYLSPENWEHSITNDFSGKSIVVQGLTLSAIFEKYEIVHCDLVKMNCEGAEFKIVFDIPPNLLSKIKMMLILFHEDLVASNHNRNALKNYFIEHNFWVRESRTRKNRGWIIAKNKMYYKKSITIRTRLNRWLAFIN